MKIKKIGHCCLVIEVNGIRIITDPGAWSDKQNFEKNIDVILITHEHADHLHIDSLKAILSNNPNAKIFTNKRVAKLLDEENISYELIQDGDSLEFLNTKFEGFGLKHADIYESIEPVENTGYLIAEKLFYPGDAFTDPGRNIDILALPVAGPWLKLSEAIDYAKQLKPKKCFPVHDGILKYLGPSHKLPESELKKEGIEFISLNAGDEIDF